MIVLEEEEIPIEEKGFKPNGGITYTKQKASLKAGLLFLSSLLSKKSVFYHTPHPLPPHLSASEKVWGLALDKFEVWVYNGDSTKERRKTAMQVLFSQFK